MRIIKIMAFLVSLVVLLNLSYLVLSLGVLFGTDSSVVRLVSWRHVYLVDGQDINGYEAFEGYMEKQGWYQKERLGGIWIFEKDSDKISLISGTKGRYILFYP